MLPRLLIVDDLFGRADRDGCNDDRARLCGQLLLADVTSDGDQAAARRIKQPIAEVVFHRGQRPAYARVGDVVENDLDGVAEVVRTGWVRAVKPWSLVLIDLCFYTGAVTSDSDNRARGMPEGRGRDDDPAYYFGLDVLARVHSEFPDLPIVILSSKPRDEVSERFARDGALGFLDRNVPNPATALQEVIQQHGLIPDATGTIVGQSRRLLQALRRARQLARNGENLLIRGETGTGKELLADYIRRHTTSGASRSARPFVIVNSGAQNEQMYYSELFGHRKGSFTGADADRDGAIIEANGGDVFLDEIANMPLAVQNGVLRVLESGEVVPYGAKKKDLERVSVRFLSATHGALEDMVGAGDFREDLYQRLRQGGMVFLPPLRERSEDIPMLVEAFVRTAESQIPGTRTRRVSEDAMALLQSQSWPRNVRQLRECILDAVSRYPDLEHLLPRHLDLPVESLGLPVPAQKPAGEVPSPVAGARTFQSLLQDLEAFPFQDLPDDELAGRLQNIEAGFARFLVRYLQAGLRRHRRADGRLFIQPALEYLMGTSVSAASAYDIIKRFFRRGDRELMDLLKDPVLREAYDKSHRGRPSRGGKRKKDVEVG